MAEHVMYKRESAWGTYVAPTATGTPLGTGGAVSVESFNVTPNLNFMEMTDTGPGGRGRLAGAPGEIAVSGSMQTKLYPQALGRFLRGVMGTRAVTAASESTGVAITSHTQVNPTVLLVASIPTGGKVGDAILISGHSGGTPNLNGIHYITAIPDATHLTLDVESTVAGSWSGGNAKLTTNRNKLLFNDNTSFDSFSFQKYFDATHAEYLRGCKTTKFNISVRSKEFAKFTMDFVGKDATKNGGTWADLSAAPAITPYTHSATGSAGAWFYPPVTTEPLKFYQASIRSGGTVAVTAGELVVTSGTARTEIDNLSIDVDLGLGTDAYGVVLDDRTVQSIDEGPRVITITFEPNFKSVWFEFYDLWKANPQTALVLEAYFRGPVAYTTGGPAYTEYKFTFPNVRITAAPPPDNNAAYGLKRQTVTAQAAVDPVTGYDMGVVIQCPEDYTV